MDILKKKRKVVRTAFGRLYNALNEAVSNWDPDNRDDSKVWADLELLREKADELAKMDEEVMNLLLQEEAGEEELDKEMQSADEYASKYKRISIYVQKRVSAAVKVEEDDNSILNVNKRKFRLPTLEFKKFGGDVKDWLTFWSQFKKIDEDPEMDDADKFQYLLQATTPKTRAREVVESFPPTGSNYSKAMGCLKARFGREELLVEFYVRELLKLTLVMNSKEGRVMLSSLYDRIETQLRALETLGVATDKYAAMLFPLVESCLSEEVLRAWQRHSNTSLVQQNGQTRLDSLMSFLKNEVEGEERITMAIQGFSFGTNVRSTKPPKMEPTNLNKSVVPTTADLVNCKHSKLACVFCEGSHSSDTCFKAQKMSIEEKRDLANRKKCCFACLKIGHIQRRCRAVLKCILCEGRHVPVMCPKSERAGEAKLEPVVESSLSNVNGSQVFLQTIMVKLRGAQERKIRVLLDPGSQRSYIRRDVAQGMHYKPTGEEELIHGLFGGETTKPRRHLCYQIHLQSLDNKYACNFEALDEEEICSRVPVLQQGSWLSELRERGIEVSVEEERPIEVLIGADIYGKLLTGRREILHCGLVAVETYLGWTVTGKLQSGKKSSSMTVLSMFAHCETVSQLWELDVLGIQDPGRRKDNSEAEGTVKAFFLDTVKVKDDGRYEVRLPWIEGHPPVPRNFNLSKRRLEKVLRKLEENKLKTAYDEVFVEWLGAGIIEEVPVSQWDEGHYLPHRPVVKESGTTRVRPVFDASARESGQPSLNQCLEKGVNLIEMIPALLLRFRLHRIGIIADIRKAFLQISLCEEDRDFLRFLWVNKEGVLKIFRHARVAFGVTSSPFLLGAVIDFHLKKYCEGPSETTGYARGTIEKLRKSLYVDNCVTSVETERDLHLFTREASQMFAEAKFDLRGWEYTDLNMENHSNTAVLGLMWDRKADTLAVSSLKAMKVEVVTRRIMLSMAQRVFDPIGFTCPISLSPKLLLQRCWEMKGEWDQEVPEDVRNEFLLWLRDLPLLGEVKIPRWLRGIADNVTNCSLHTFCDASKAAYAAAVFVRVEYNSCVQVQLIQAKSRVSPIKPLTIPRLELLAATVGARLAVSVKEGIDQDHISLFFWSDSAAVISWIQKEDTWSVFVWNRVQEIRSLTSRESWRHVPGALNPADLPSRGCSVQQLRESRWWEGPPWLKLPPEEWPAGEVPPDEDVVRQERKRGIVPSLLCNNERDDWYYAFSTDYDKVVRVLAWILRFVHSCRKQRSGNCQGRMLQYREIILAENRVIKYVQTESFTGLQDERIASLDPFVDAEGIIRLKTRITERVDVGEFGTPAVLPSRHPIVERLVLSTHGKLCHVGVQGLLSHLREKFWILKGRKSIRGILSKCVICRRHEARPVTASQPVLPEPRVRDAAVFETTGVDLAGPLFLRDGHKVWVCLYTCAVYRAVHLELASSLATDSFIQTFRRFVARRGRPAIVYSDNGTNFVGIDNAFGRLDWEKISKHCAIERIDWRFNPPTAAWWGGWWERLIRLLKQLLRKTLGKASLTYEELATVLCDCESVINSRPLTYVSEDIKDLVPITPSMFLLDLQGSGLADCDAVDAGCFNRRIRYRQRVRESLRQRFRKEYLGQLILTAKKKGRKLQPGEVVLIGTENH